MITQTESGLPGPIFGVKRVLALDGLRFFAIAAVVFSHTSPGGIAGMIGAAGWVGVDLFFVLSGFLITRILLRDIEDPHYYRNFIIRRGLRIFPLYYACLAVFLFATWVTDAGQWRAMQQWGIPWLVFYVGNIRAAVAGFPPVFSFSPLWSLQVEEQFYLLYPFCVRVFSRDNLTRLLWVCVFGALALRGFLIYTGNTHMTYILTPCRMDSLAIGGLCATGSFQRLIPKWAFGPLAAGSVMVLLQAALNNSDDLTLNPIVASIGYTLFALTFGGLLCRVLQGTGAALLESRPLTYVGKISYGVYLLHGPVAFTARKVALLMGVLIEPRSWTAFVLTSVLSVVVAAASWHFFEEPILRLKSKFEPAAVRDASVRG